MGYESSVTHLLSKDPPIVCHLLRRFLQVEEVASMVGWLVSEENSFTTGSAFDLSGGRATY